MCYEFDWFVKRSEAKKAHEGENMKPAIESAQAPKAPVQPKQPKETRKPETVEAEPEPV